MDVICNKLKHYFSGDFSPNMEELNDLLAEMCFELIQGLHGMKSDTEKKILIKQHLEKVQDLYSKVDKFPDFKTGLDWVNTKEPLSVRNNLNGKLVLLDFFTYCCINCMHIIPDLKKLEEEFSVEDGLVVIGVHNAKFTNERVTENIEAAVKRYGICHPVVNDSIEGMWSSLGVSCWPTQVILGPRGEPLFTVAGEGHAEAVRLIIATGLEHFAMAGVLSKQPIEALSGAVESTNATSTLLFPGKIAVAPSGAVMAVADTGHHRVLIATSSGSIIAVVGGMKAGFEDGKFENACFRAPQGLCFVGDQVLYVADTENHAIRKIDLVDSSVTTVAGTGKQGGDRCGGGRGRAQALASPWDLLHLPKHKALLIAMAGTHQLWALALSDTTLFGDEVTEGVCLSVVGSGAEENRNGAYRRRAGLAQPSGLALGDGSVYFADSESSAVRAVSLDNGAVSLLAGGAPDPTNLFAYGDIDGVGTAAKLQHPLDVTWHDGLVFVADSYNHKLKKIDPKTRMCTTVDSSLYKLNEPGGLCCHGNLLYIADTNNHAIKCLDLETFSVKEIPVKMDTLTSVVKPTRKLSSDQPKPQAPVKKTYDREWTVEVAPGGNAKILLEVDPTPFIGASSPVWQLYYPVGKSYGQSLEGWKGEWSLQCQNESTSANLRGRMSECDGDLCRLRQFDLLIQVVPASDGPVEAHVAIHDVLKT